MDQQPDHVEKRSYHPSLLAPFKNRQIRVLPFIKASFFYVFPLFSALALNVAAIYLVDALVSNGEAPPASLSASLLCFLILAIGFLLVLAGWRFPFLRLTFWQIVLLLLGAALGTGVSVQYIAYHATCCNVAYIVGQGYPFTVLRSSTDPDFPGQIFQQWSGHSLFTDVLFYANATLILLVPLRLSLRPLVRFIRRNASQPQTALALPPQPLQRSKLSRGFLISQVLVLILVLLGGTLAAVTIGISNYNNQMDVNNTQVQLNATATAETKECLLTPSASSGAPSIYTSVATPSKAPETPPMITGTPVTLSNALNYADIIVGSGVAAKSGNTLKVEYTGWVVNGCQEFASTYDDKGKPYMLTIGQGQNLSGWDQGLIGVKTGGTRRLSMHAALDFGSKDEQAEADFPSIPDYPYVAPNDNLLFDVTVLSIT
jgi:FKBP-type peptidyl-prolyl cis-trans isomerase